MLYEQHSKSSTLLQCHCRFCFMCAHARDVNLYMHAGHARGGVAVHTRACARRRCAFNNDDHDGLYSCDRPAQLN